MRRPPLAAILVVAAWGGGGLVSPAAGQTGGAPVVIAPIPPGKPPPLGAGPADNLPRSRDPGDAGPSEQFYASGTGFVVADRRLLTNRHVVAPCARIVARDGAGVRRPARIVATDRDRDLAVLSTDASLGPALPFRDSPAVRRGETVIAYGYPLSGLLSSGPTLTTGNVNALAGLRDNANNFQISAAVQPGSSGGPLFDGQGNVIGVVVSKLNAAKVAELTGGDIPQNVNFAVKGSVAIAFLRANGVQPLVVASSGAEKRAEEVDAIANPSTVYLQCLR